MFFNIIILQRHPAVFTNERSASEWKLGWSPARLPRQTTFNLIIHWSNRMFALVFHLKVNYCSLSSLKSFRFQSGPLHIEWPVNELKQCCVCSQKLSYAHTNETQMPNVFRKQTKFPIWLFPLAQVLSFSLFVKLCTLPSFWISISEERAEMEILAQSDH